MNGDCELKAAQALDDERLDATAGGAASLLPAVQKATGESASFASAHPGGANFLLADGSVR